MSTATTATTAAATTAAATSVATPTAATIHLPPTVQPVRALVWALHLALPVAALWLLLAQPAVDIIWQHPPSHFWLVLVVAAVNVVLGGRMSVVAHRHTDARLFLVSLAFLTSAGFLLLHALATPGVLIAHQNAGFDLAQPIGLAIASVFALASALVPNAPGAGRWFLALVWVRAGVGVLLVAWAVVSLADLPPLNQAPATRDVEGPLTTVAVAAVVLYVVAAVRYYFLHRRAPAAVLLSLVTAFVLLAESMVAVILANKWHLSWWEWHVLLTFAFGFVAYSAYVQYRREGTSAGLFDAIALDQTTKRIRAEYGAALEELVTALQERERDGDHSGDARAGGPSIAARLAERFGLTEGQTAVLDRAGAALATERDLTRRLSALVAVGEQARVGLGDDELVAEVVRRLRPAYGDVRIGLVSDGRLEVGGRAYDPEALAAASGDDDGMAVLPLSVKGQVAGVLEVPRPWAGVGVRHGGHDPLLLTLANQLSISLENARLYRELGTLFRQYMSPDVAAALLADPDQAALGGSLVEVTALFADLRGFTTFSEGVEPAEIVRMLNHYHGARGAVHPRQRRHDRPIRGRCLAGPVQRPRPADRPRAAGGASGARDAGGRRRRSRRRSPVGRDFGSAPTPARRSWATSAARRSAASTRWATPSTWPPGCRHSPSRDRSSSGRRPGRPSATAVHGRATRRPRGKGSPATRTSVRRYGTGRMTASYRDGEPMIEGRGNREFWDLLLPDEAAGLEAVGRRRDYRRGAVLVREADRSDWVRGPADRAGQGGREHGRWHRSGARGAWPRCPARRAVGHRP